MLGSSLAALVLPLILSHLSVLAAPTQPHTLAHVKRAEPHEVTALFKRQNPAPNPSDPAFASHYPPYLEIPSTASIPAAWLQRLASLRLPSSCPQASGTGSPSYNGANPGDGSICSFTYGCSSNEDLKDAPPGRLAISFDDGPAEGTEALWSYMGTQGARGIGTHFMIGSYVLNNAVRFQQLAQEGHIGVHTWSHKYTTTLSNEQIVGELGWTMQLMADLNGGRVPRFWRPPYGDVDNRVRAIAKGVFGLETVTWNQDTGDWNIGYNAAYTVGSVTQEYLGWLRGDKGRGLNVLQHELSNSDVEVFAAALPRAREMGWVVGNIADSWGLPWYQNADGARGAVRGMNVGGQAPEWGTPTSASASSAQGQGRPTGMGPGSGPWPRPSDPSSSIIAPRPSSSALPPSSASVSLPRSSSASAPASSSVAPSPSSSSSSSLSAPAVSTSSLPSGGQNDLARPSPSTTSGAGAVAYSKVLMILAGGAALALAL